MFTNRITQYLTSRPPVDDSSANGNAPAGFMAISLPGASQPTASIYEVAREAAIREAREKLLALLRSRQSLLEGN